MYWADSLWNKLSLFALLLPQKTPSIMVIMILERETGKTLTAVMGVWALACTALLGTLALVMPHLRCTASIWWWTTDSLPYFMTECLVDMTKPNASLVFQDTGVWKLPCSTMNKESWLFIRSPYSASWLSICFNCVDEAIPLLTIHLFCPKGCYVLSTISRALCGLPTCASGESTCQCKRLRDAS